MNRSIAKLQSAFARVMPALLAVVLCLALSPPARGDDDLRSLELYNGAEAEIVSGNRSPRPASQTAENITVVTAEEIEALNAHTLADILYNVTGVQLEMNRTPGTVVNIEIQGANFNHVLVLIDNVPINNLADNFANISAIPVQMIERVEIVKGAASSSWGNALGGVVNVITKSPDPERIFGGMLSGSFGTRETVDGRVELSGTKSRFGYYLTGGKLRSDGLLQNNMVNQDNFYAKLHYDLPMRGSLSLTTGITDGTSGMFGAGLNTGNQDTRQLISTLTAQYQVMDHLRLDASLITTQSDDEIMQRAVDPGGNLRSLSFNSKESRLGGSFKVSWLDDLQRITAGVDYEHAKAHVSIPLIRADLLDRSADRFGVYLSDTLTLGRFAVTPSARFDDTGSGGDHFSPSFGITYALTENSVLRGYTARGYSLTSLNRSGSTEKVWTSQLGFETGEIPHLWLKGTLFRNDTWDVGVEGPGGVVEQRQLMRGVEVEAKTLPFFNTSLSAGYMFNRATEGENGPVIKGIARHTMNVGIRYHDPALLNAELTGHYVDWNQPTGKYGAVIWDLHLRKKIEYSEYGSLELFLSVRNLLDDDQYLSSIYANPGRWGEAGVRCNF